MGVADVNSRGRPAELVRGLLIVMTTDPEANDGALEVPTTGRRGSNRGRSPPCTCNVLLLLLLLEAARDGATDVPTTDVRPSKTGSVPPGICRLPAGGFGGPGLRSVHPSTVRSSPPRP